MAQSNEEVEFLSSIHADITEGIDEVQYDISESAESLQYLKNAIAEVEKPEGVTIRILRILNKNASIKNDSVIVRIYRTPVAEGK